MIEHNLFIDSLILCYLAQSKLSGEQKIKMPCYKPESFDTTIIRPRVKFERIDTDMPFFKDTMVNNNKE